MLIERAQELGAIGRDMHEHYRTEFANLGADYQRDHWPDRGHDREHTKAWEVMRVAKRGERGLHQCDAHFGYARLDIKEGKPAAARVHLKSAASLVSECGYHRRDGEIEALEIALA